MDDNIVIVFTDDSNAVLNANGMIQIAALFTLPPILSALASARYRLCLLDASVTYQYYESIGRSRAQLK